LLLLLVRSNGSLVDRDTIAAQLWPKTPLSENNLSQHVYLLRRRLNECAKDRDYVVTVRGKGFRFVAPVSVAAPGLTAQQLTAQRRTFDRGFALRSDAEPEVVQQYCRGCYLLERRTASALGDATRAFDAALHLRPGYVPALIGLARSYGFLAQYSYAPGSYAYPKAKAAALRALELDSSSADARATLGTLLLFCDWNWKAAEREIDTAIRLNPKSTSVYVNAAWFYTCKGSRENALRYMEQALLVEPSSPVLQMCLARGFLHIGEFQRAIEAFSSLIETVPDLSIARRHRAQAYLLNAQPAEALADLLVLPVDRADDLALRLPLLARAYADCGETERAEEIYRVLLETSHTEFVTECNLALVAVGLRRLDEALQHLEHALERREPALLLLYNLPWFEPIAQRARFKAVLRATDRPLG
ncbi:MAG: winged helix-turn-helix domain-containing protein, partial [Candidatus Eremiobacteraeota bacterium]|nr:winged helix-turn-helix domain-containing protein [Candidatus Eremiobacteraeota bacterium]